MPELCTQHFGRLEYDDGSVFRFPAGIPGYEQEREFLFLERPVHHPLVFMQSVGRPPLCFLTLPIRVVDQNYRLHLSAEDLALLDLPPERQPDIGTDVICLALISLAPDQPATANLLAPVVVNLRNRKATQAIQVDTDYNYRHPLPCGAEAVCS